MSNYIFVFSESMEKAISFTKVLFKAFPFMKVCVFSSSEALLTYRFKHRAEWIFIYAHRNELEEFQKIRRIYPESEYIITADDDSFKAQAEELCVSKYLIPPFTAEKLRKVSENFP